MLKEITIYEIGFNGERIAKPIVINTAQVTKITANDANTELFAMLYNGEWLYIDAESRNNLLHS